MHHQTSVRTDADYADIPEAAKFSIDEANAKSIVRLAGLVKANKLHCLEQFDNWVDWDWGEDSGTRTSNGQKGGFQDGSLSGSQRWRE